MTEGQQALQLVTGFECSQCYNSGWIYSDQVLKRCCWGSRDLAIWKAMRQFAIALSMQVVGPRHLIENLDLKAFDCARALICATARRPVRGFTLAQFLGLGKGWEREIKAVIQTLRDEWHLPIGSLRVPPYGYYWISTPAEFLAWFEPMRSQAMSELKTAYRLMKRHYPALAGQFTFNFDEEATHNEEQA